MIKPVDKYKYWDVYDKLPEGWVIDKQTGSPLYMAVFITDGVAPIKGGKRALLLINENPSPNQVDKKQMSIFDVINDTCIDKQE